MHPALESKREELESLCRRHHVRRLWVFGSAARDDFDPQRSDADFAVEFGPDYRLGGFGGDYFALWMALEDLLGRSVDLVETQAIRNPRFRQEVERSRRTLYAA